jgi:hypothetical protein
VAKPQRMSPRGEWRAEVGPGLHTRTIFFRLLGLVDRFENNPYNYFRTSGVMEEDVLVLSPLEIPKSRVTADLRKRPPVPAEISFQPESETPGANYLSQTDACLYGHLPRKSQNGSVFYACEKNNSQHMDVSFKQNRNWAQGHHDCW